MIAVIDYNTGNLCSVINALGRIGVESVVTNDPEIIISADKILLPGVGAADKAMDNLRANGLDVLIKTLKKPTLGICVGMQLMCESSSEGDVQCMGIFNTKVVKFDSQAVKVPHVGWNTITNLKTDLFRYVKDDSFVYYVHSFHAELSVDTIATTNYGIPFSGALSRDNFFGVQFHPEKSGDIGEVILKNFIEL